MPIAGKFAVSVVVASAATAVVPGSASAAWSKAGSCTVPAAQASSWDDLDAANNRFKTTRVPCYIAAYAISDMIRENKFSRTRFRHRSMGARWEVRLSCRSRVAKQDAPQPGRVVTCRATSGTDAETNRGTAKKLTGGTIRWVTNYTG